MNSRNISSEQLELYKTIVDKPDLLQQLFELAVNKIGFFTSHATRAIEYSWIFETIIASNSKTLIDVGAGVSVLPFALADRGCKVTTVDYSNKIRTLADKDSWTEWGFLNYSLLDQKIQSFNSKLEDLKLKPESFDAVYSISVIEHMPKALRLKLLECSANIVKPNGIFALTLDLIPKSSYLWNRDRGKIVEAKQEHGLLINFLNDANSFGWQIEKLEIVRKLPKSITDLALIVFRKQHDNTKNAKMTNKETCDPNNLKKVFSTKFSNGGWTGSKGESVSGIGSTLSYTFSFRTEFERWLKENNIKSILDAPCGDFNWFKKISVPELNYIGMDIVKDLIELNQKNYAAENRIFLEADITCDNLLETDVMLCRDCLMHLTFSNCFSFFNNFLRSNIPFLFLTSHVNSINKDLLIPGKFRQINFIKPPFNFPESFVAIKDYTTGYP